MISLKLRSTGWRQQLVTLLAGFAISLLSVSANAQGTYFDPSLGVGDSVIRSDVFVGDRQGRTPAMEGLFTRQMSGWLTSDGEVLRGVVVHVGRGCIADPYLANPAGKIALIERGICMFSEKITRAYNNGAIGAIIYNSELGGGDLLVRMGPLNPGLVPIPGFFVGRSAGLTLAATPVIVKIQAASFRVLKDGVVELLQNGTLTRKQAGLLKDKISAASDAVNAGNFDAARSLLLDFQADVVSLLIAGVVPASETIALVNASFNIIVKLQPPFTESM